MASSAATRLGRTASSLYSCAGFELSNLGRKHFYGMRPPAMRCRSRPDMLLGWLLQAGSKFTVAQMLDISTSKWRKSNVSQVLGGDWVGVTVREVEQRISESGYTRI